jgi:quinol monooxygenase YgiN
VVNSVLSTDVGQHLVNIGLAVIGITLTSKMMEEVMSSYVGLLVTLEAKSGKESELAEFLQAAQDLVAEEPDTSTWYAFRINASQFGIYDTFPHEEGRQAHLAGKVATALGARADELLASAPSIQPVEVLALT